MDLAAMYNNRAYVPLDQMATLLGYPGKMGMSGAKVWDAFKGGDLSSIRNYCETDVLNTYLVYLRFQLHRGHITEQNLQEEETFLHDYLHSSGAQEGKKHLQEFADAWSESAAPSSSVEAMDSAKEHTS